MTSIRILTLAIGAALVTNPAAFAQAPKATPWGISSSASGFKDHAQWFPQMAEAGVTTVRLFPEWRSVEPAKGTWKWDAADELVKSAETSKIEISAVLMGSPPSAKAIHAFPMKDLAGWQGFVSSAVSRYKNDIHYWEVWNEGNGGFNDEHHTTTDYAKLAIATYNAAKKADPSAQVGLTVASYDPAYLNHTILAMKKLGEPQRFDYLCIHPYEIADGLARVDGEIPYLWMSKLLRDQLKISAPDKANAEIWITEVGRRLDNRPGHVVTQQDAASAFAKLYVMAIAQGIARVQWFEAQDPAGEDQGFGLLNRDGSQRAAYKTLRTLSTVLGPTPKYQGWLSLGSQGRGYGFVFTNKETSVLVAWMPKGEIDKTLWLAGDVKVIDSVSGSDTPLKTKQALELTDTPQLIVGLPAELLKQAQANAAKKFPWGGDYSASKMVSFQPGAEQPCQGVFPVGGADSPTVKFADGSAGVVVQGDIGHPISFYVHPSFANLATKEYYIRASVRRLGSGNVGMNCLYEVADSKGQGAYANTGKWGGTTDSSDWQTITWEVKDACFAKMWGYDFVLRPEQSVPFAIGKIEVSTEPFGK